MDRKWHGRSWKRQETTWTEQLGSRVARRAEIGWLFWSSVWQQACSRSETSDGKANDETRHDVSLSTNDTRPLWMFNSDTPNDDDFSSPYTHFIFSLTTFFFTTVSASMAGALFIFWSAMADTRMNYR